MPGNHPRARETDEFRALREQPAFAGLVAEIVDTYNKTHGVPQGRVIRRAVKNCAEIGALFAYMMVGAQAEHEQEGPSEA